MTARRSALGIGAGLIVAMAAGMSVDAAPSRTAAASQPAAPLVAMRRLTEAQYRRSIADIFSPEIKLTGRFEPEVRREGLIAIGSSEASISAGGMEQYYAMAGSIAEQVTGPEGRGRFVSCTPADSNAADSACARAFLSHYGRLLFRRPLDKAELDGQVALAGRIADKGKDFYLGLTETLSAMLASPHFLFRIEREMRPGSGSPALIDDLTKASRLSFLMWNAPPDDALLAAAERGVLSTPAGLQGQVERLAASPRLADGISAFFDDMLQMDRFAALTKDSERFPKYSQVLADEARAQTLRTLVDLLVTRNGDYRDVFTTRDTFLTRTLALAYKVPYLSNEKWAPYSFPADGPRAGVLTQISFLALFSHPAVSSPTKRGVALNEIFLCQETPQPPGNVDFTAINSEGPARLKTMRLRLEAHNENPVCKGCHSLVDPTGIALERFDTLGQYREREEGEPIDVGSALGGKPFEGAVGLGTVLRDDPRTASCVTRNLYATGTGRADAPGDAERIEALTGKFAAGGYRLPVFLKALALSDDLYLVPQPAPRGHVAMVSPANSPTKSENRP